MVMGDYCDTVHMNVLTSKRHSSTASPELVKLKGVRTVMCEEPDDTEPVSTADIKVWTGEGQIVGRGLFSKVIVSFKPQFSMMVLMNNIVDLKSKDEGFARRLDNVEFPYRFVNEPKMPNEKQIVIGMAEAFLKDIEYRQALMFMLLDVWKTDNPIVNGIVKPAEVVAFTKDYLLEQDVVRMFINEKIDFVEVEKQDDTEWIHGSNFITYQSLENAFKSSHYYDHNSKKPKNWFNNQMRNLNLVSVKKTWKKGGHHNSMMYIGLAYKNVENDDDI
jgi:putative DNA primase/helicase